MVQSRGCGNSYAVSVDSAGSFVPAHFPPHVVHGNTLRQVPAAGTVVPNSGGEEVTKDGSLTAASACCGRWVELVLVPRER